MRSAIVDNRSRSMWLLAGLGVLIWAAFGVFLSSVAAHADETPAHPSQHSHRQAPVKALKSAAVQATPELRTRTRALPAQAKHAVARITDPVRVDPRHGEELAQVRSDYGTHARGWHEAHRPTQAAVAVKHIARGESHALAKNHAPAMHHVHGKSHTHGDHRADATRSSPAASSSARTAPAAAMSPASAAAPAAAPASATSSATLAAPADAPTRSPIDSRDTSAQHQPAAPPSAASAPAATSASPGVVPGAAHPGDVLGPLLTATHTEDAVLPSGPARTTDSTPD